jgi:hypothetical protein
MSSVVGSEEVHAMNHARTYRLIALLAFASPVALHAETLGERTTCKTLGSAFGCATVRVAIEDWGDPLGRVFLAAMTGWVGDPPFLPSAFGFYAKTDPGFFGQDMFSAPSGWGSAGPARWTVNPFSRHISLPGLGDYTLFATSAALRGEDRWPATVMGLVGDLNVWPWEGPVPTDFLIVWRGESEDGSIDFDCFQDPRGGSECMTATPEPTTVVLVLTGMTFLAAAHAHTRRRHTKDMAG